MLCTGPVICIYDVTELLVATLVQCVKHRCVCWLDALVCELCDLHAVF